MDKEPHDDSKFMARRLKFACILAMLVLLCVIVSAQRGNLIWLAQRTPFISRFFRPTIEIQTAIYGAAARARLVPKFSEKGMQYPPDKVAFIAIKSTNELLLYASEPDKPFKYICAYPILGASGHLGPKLREGDLQVPEGIYQLSLEPNTPYHLALRLNYPNASDLARAAADGRAHPGSDILIHGTTGSIGCIAMGDPVSEDLFVVAHDSNNKPIPLIIAPVDLRLTDPPAPNPEDPKWLADLYSEIKSAMTEFPKPN